MTKTLRRITVFLCLLSAASARAESNPDRVKRLKDFFKESLSDADLKALYHCGAGTVFTEHKFTVPESGITAGSMIVQCEATGTAFKENAGFRRSRGPVHDQARRKISTDFLSKHGFEVKEKAEAAGILGYHNAMSEFEPAIPSTWVLTDFGLHARTAVSAEEAGAALQKALDEQFPKWVDDNLKRIYAESAKNAKRNQSLLGEGSRKLKKLAAEFGAILADPNIKKADNGPKY